MTRRLLAIDAATDALSLALFDDESAIAGCFAVVGRGHAERLVPAIADLPLGGKADEILVNAGPGSFTGVRIGLAAARALGLAWDVPVRGYDALSNVAAAARTHAPPGQDSLVIVMLGGHGELFTQTFATETLMPRTAMRSVPAAELAATLLDTTIFGTGAEQLVALRGHGKAVPLYPDARRVLQMPLEARRLPPSAIYGRGADAKPMALTS